MIFTDNKSVWDIEWLLKLYKEDVVVSVLKQGWAIDELDCGVPIETIEDMIWEDYEAWADKYLEDRKMEQYE